MRRSYLGALLVGLGLLMGSAPAFAHHSFVAEFDSQAPITLTGVITKVEWTNPHIYFYMNVKDANGKVQTWALEGYPPHTLRRTGFMREDLKPGITVTVTGWKSRDGSLRAAGREVTFPDGSKKYAGPPAR
jgi:hypothetical protein